MDNCKLELPQIDLFLHEIKDFEWEIYLKLSSKERDIITSIQSPLSSFKTILISQFKLSNTDSFQDFFRTFEELYPRLITLKKPILSIHKYCY